MIAQLALAALTAALPTQPDLPTDPAQRSAIAAIQGDKGPLKEWQTTTYKIILADGITCRGYTYLTSYGPWESPRMSGGPNAAQCLPGGKSRRLDTSMCAADRGLQYGTVVWADGVVRVVRDRGGWVTVPRARAKHRRNERNLDFYTLKPDQHSSRSTPYAIVCTAADVHRRCGE